MGRTSRLLIRLIVGMLSPGRISGRLHAALSRISPLLFRQLMKLAGILFLLAGWTIVLYALDLLRSNTALVAFVLAGVAVECIGISFLFRSHLPLHKETR